MRRAGGFVEGQQKDIKTNECWGGGAINRCTNNLIQRGGGAATTQAKDTSPPLELVNQLIAGPVRCKKVSNVEIRYDNVNTCQNIAKPQYEDEVWPGSPRYPVDQPEGNIRPCVGGKLLKRHTPVW